MSAECPSVTLQWAFFYLLVYLLLRPAIGRVRTWEWATLWDNFLLIYGVVALLLLLMYYLPELPSPSEKWVEEQLPPGARYNIYS